MNKIYIMLVIIFITLFSLARLELVKEYDREFNNINIPDSIKSEVIYNTEGLSDLEIINWCVTKTSELLEYSFKEDTLFENKISKAHCVTYSKVCATLCNLAFDYNNIPSKAKCVVGYVKLYNLNLCKLGTKIFKNYSNYFVNHDFVEINNKDYCIYVDPTLFDLIGSDLKYLKNSR